MNLRIRSWLILLIYLVTTNAFAHSWSNHGIVEGAAHPFLGLDHLLAALAVGLWSAQKYTSVTIIPFTFIFGMVIGSAFGFLNLSLPYTEFGILLSVLLMGVVLYIPSKLSLKVAIPCMLVFGFCHGHAHGLELRWTDSAALTLFGFVVSTALLHVIGVAFVKFLRFSTGKRFANNVISLSGAGVAGMAIFLFFK